MMTHLVPFHKGNGTGGTDGTRLDNDFQGLPPIERTQGHFFVPLVPLVSHIPRNGTEQDAGIKTGPRTNRHIQCEVFCCANVVRFTCKFLIIN